MDSVATAHRELSRLTTEDLRTLGRSLKKSVIGKKKEELVNICIPFWGIISDEVEELLKQKNTSRQQKAQRTTIRRNGGKQLRDYVKNLRAGDKVKIAVNRYSDKLNGHEFECNVYTRLAEAEVVSSRSTELNVILSNYLQEREAGMPLVGTVITMRYIEKFGFSMDQPPGPAFSSSRGRVVLVHDFITDDPKATPAPPTIEALNLQPPQKIQWERLAKIFPENKLDSK